MKKMDLTDGLSLLTVALTGAAGLISVLQTAFGNKLQKRQISEEITKQLDERSKTSEETK